VTNLVYSANIGRAVLGRELATIHDYRQRIAQYRTDQYLLAAHERGPWITVWSVEAHLSVHVSRTDDDSGYVCSFGSVVAMC
jgi:phosphodiesterase/alkaline phosphatase D-like protein